ncbi:hypothetical protein [Jeongeupia chitinilytica]|uniref:t-SNARE coiled-coil homology domain-containing protein n=1 Tax=Jeongeupia chitinilytica TaxID=1041641 RepID=A0ABQ3GXN3_9NEIS|nr:hypothetical protein [Jeongeupia chitinilytica]GHD60126.1 hypothetical protein GCM10007350_12590 [Jeongeupia chitinilytica]
MAINWLVALQAIPWGQVIENTPKIIDATKKLFTKARSIDPPREIVIDAATAPDDAARIARLERLVEENRHELITLHEGLQASTRLLDELAGQNARMIGEIEVLRRRGRVQVWFCAVLALLLIGVVLRVA